VLFGKCASSSGFLGEQIQVDSAAGFPSLSTRAIFCEARSKLEDVFLFPRGHLVQQHNSWYSTIP
jgi:hypothetical protein